MPSEAIVQNERGYTKLGCLPNLSILKNYLQKNEIPYDPALNFISEHITPLTFMPEVCLPGIDVIKLRYRIPN